MGILEERFGDDMSIMSTSGLSSFGYQVTGFKTELGCFIATNINAAVRYLKLYDKATTVDPVTDTPVLRVAVPANGSVIWNSLNKIEFSNGLSVVATSTGGDATGCSPTAGNVQFFAQYNLHTNM